MKEFWTTGITVKCGIGDQNKVIGWSAECKWYSRKFMENGCIEGEIGTRYYEPTITEVIDYILECLRMFGIKLCNEIEEMKEMGFALYSNEERNYYPKEVLQIIKDEAERRGWKYYIEL